LDILESENAEDGNIKINLACAVMLMLSQIDMMLFAMHIALG